MFFFSGRAKKFLPNSRLALEKSTYSIQVEEIFFCMCASSSFIFSRRNNMIIECLPFMVLERAPLRVIKKKEKIFFSSFFLLLNHKVQLQCTESV